MRRTCIVDSDPGVDDALALLLMLGSSDQLRLIGITITHGNLGNEAGKQKREKTESNETRVQQSRRHSLSIVDLHLFHSPSNSTGVDQLCRNAQRLLCLCDRYDVPVVRSFFSLFFSSFLRCLCSRRSGVARGRCSLPLTRALRLFTEMMEWATCRMHIWCPMSSSSACLCCMTRQR